MDGYNVHDGQLDVNQSTTALEASDFDLADTPTLDNDLSNLAGTTINLEFRDNDTDNDGVDDATDIDDDNDGILDTIEGLTGPTAISGTVSGNTVNYGTAGHENAVTFTGSFISVGGNGNAGYVEAGNASSLSTRTISFATPIPELELRFGNTVAGTAFENFTITYSNGTVQPNVTVAQIGGDLQIQNGGTVVRGSGSGNNQGDGRIRFTNLIDDLRIVSVSFTQFDRATANGTNRTASVGVLVPNIVSEQDVDLDGIVNYLDIDSDNDGITDNVEGQLTANYVTPSGSVADGSFVDNNNDGLDDAYDSVEAGTIGQNADGSYTHSGTGLTPVDTDNDTTADSHDLDSDDDGIEDASERGTPGPVTAQTAVTSDVSSDTDGDGLLDVFEGSSIDDHFDVNDQNVTATGDFSLSDTDGDIDADGLNAVSLIFDLDYRDSDEAKDTDNDEIIDRFDIDDDNDGILDLAEGIALNVWMRDSLSTASKATLNGNGFDVLNTSNGWNEAWFSENVADITRGATDYQLNFSVSNTNTKSFMIGFNETGNNTLASYHDIDYAIYVFGDQLRVYENGTNRGLHGTYAVGDTLSVRKSGTTITYLKNGAAFYTSTVAANAADYHIDSSFLNGVYTIENLSLTSGSMPFNGSIDGDGDGRINSLDIDSDNDGITDNVEAQSTANYIAPSGIGGTTSWVDNNLDGLDDRYDGGQAGAGSNAAGTYTHSLIGLTPVNTDSADNADYLDTDSDNDGIYDLVEAGFAANDADQDGRIDPNAGADGSLGTADDVYQDVENDGLLDAVDANVGFDVNDDNLSSLGEFTLPDADADVDADRGNAVPLTTDFDWREDLPPVVDLNSAASVSDTDVDFVSTFTEGGGAVNVTDTDAGVNDFAEDDIAELSIVLGSIADAGDEIVTVNGVAIPLDTTNQTDTTTSVGGVAVTIFYDASNNVITIVPTDGMTPLLDTAMAAVLQGITYENTSPVPTTGDRTFTFKATDVRGNVSANAVATVAVELNDDTADWSLSQSASSVNEGGSTTYTVTLDNALLQSGETATVELSLANVDTNSADYASFNVAVTAAVSSYNIGTNPGALTWNGTTLSFTSDATGAMGDLNIVLAASSDSLVEGPENYTVSLSNAASTTGETIGIDTAAQSVTTTINDIVATADVAQWSISGPSNADEGTTTQYTVALSGSFGSGEVITVDIGLSDIDTSSSDYSNIVSAISAAVASDPNVTFDAAAGTLSYVAPSDGASMTDIVISLDLVDDSIIEGDEDYSIDLTNAASSTGASVSIDTATNTVTTTIGDVEQPSGVVDGPAAWSLSGDASADEGGNANYTLELSGSYGANDAVSVVINIEDGGTTNLDYSSFANAITSAAGGRSDIAFDAVTSTLTFTSPADGGSMAALNFQLPIVNDAMIEGAEDYDIVLSTPSSSTGITAVLSANDTVTTTIDDTQGLGGVADGPAQWSISGPAVADEGSTAQYTVSLAGQYQASEVISVDIGISDIDTSSADYGSLVSAVNAAIVGNPGMSFNSSTGTLTYVAPADGASMTNLVIDIPITDDTFIEGTEDFSLDLSNAKSSTGVTASIDASANSAMTTINDTQGPTGAADGPGEWAITGPAAGDEGATPQYLISLSGVYGAGEVANVDIALTDIDTNSTDYANLSAAIQAAVTAYSGDGAVAFDSATGTITFTATNDGDVMDDLQISLMLIDDALVEGAEDFSIDLANAGSTTGGNIALNTSASSVTTTINDTQGIAGAADGPAQWSIAGPAAGDEGDDARFTVALDGSFGSNEAVTVDLSLSDVTTNSADYGNFVLAVQAAVDAYTGAGTVAFDQTAGTITYTANNDGDTMTDLLIDLSLTDDTIIEGPQGFSVSLSNSGSSTSAAIAIDGNAESVTTTINDTQGIGGVADGPAQWSIAGPAAGDEGDDATYTIELSGAFGAGEDGSVSVSLTDGTTNSSDYANYLTAIQSAVTNYTGPGAVTFDSTSGEITFIATNDGDQMAPLTVDLNLIDDVFAEGAEAFTIALAFASSSLLQMKAAQRNTR